MLRPQENILTLREQASKHAICLTYASSLCSNAAALALRNAAMNACSLTSALFADRADSPSGLLAVKCRAVPYARHACRLLCVACSQTRSACAAPAIPPRAVPTRMRVHSSSCASTKLSSQIKPSQIKSSQVKSIQVKSSQVKSGSIHPPAQGHGALRRRRTQGYETDRAQQRSWACTHLKDRMKHALKLGGRESPHLLDHCRLEAQ